MKSELSTGLNPTLWRTCRVLANRRRLILLQQLFRTPGLPVSEAASTTGISVMLASEYLRALNARGMLAAQRQGRFVFYRPSADPSVPFTKPLLQALRKTLSGGRASAVDRTFRSLTAFTHPRRVAIVRALVRGPLTRTELVRATHISLPAMNRHLGKLKRRDLVEIADACSLRRPTTSLDATLVAIATGTNSH